MSPKIPTPSIHGVKKSTKKATPSIHGVKQSTKKAAPSIHGAIAGKQKSPKVAPFIEPMYPYQDQIETSMRQKIVLGKNASRKELTPPILQPPPVAKKFQMSPDGATGELV